MAMRRNDGAHAPDAAGGGAGASKVDEAALRTALHHDLGLPSDRLEVDLAPPVPGVLVFHALVTGEPHSDVTGAFDGKLHTDRQDATRLVLTALGFGERDVDPVLVAATVGMLEDNPGSPYLTEQAITLAGGPPTWQPPHLTTVDGEPAVEYINSSARRPAWRSVVLQHGDGTFEVRQSPAS